GAGGQARARVRPEADLRERHMSLYTLALFAHVIGAIGISTGIGTWAFSLAGLRRARPVGPGGVLVGGVGGAGDLTVGSIIVLGVAGFYMALTAWGVQTTWIIVATVSFLLLAPFGALGLEPRVRRIAAESEKAPDGPLSTSLETRTHDPFLVSGLA